MMVPLIGARIGADGRCTFRVWAPYHDAVTVRLAEPQPRDLPLQAEGRGYFSATVSDIGPGARYWLRVGELEIPDPASQFQAEGVNGPSEIIAPNFEWRDQAWNNLALDRYVVYELHTGTFTGEGTFDAVIPRLDELRAIGITAVEVMPINQFPGARNWGYDGVGLFAAQNSYGGPLAFKRLVNACHERGLAIVLDVVYNHLGPEGNFLSQLGPYFTDHYQTPWGDALNFDSGGSDAVRAFFMANMRQWFEEFHVDALRLDAVHAIYDGSARPILAEFARFTRQLEQRLGRRLYLMPETDLNDPRIVRAPELGGFGHDAQWNDDFHHAVHALLTGERQGYYADFGRVGDLAAAYERGYVYEGQYSPYRDRRHGAPTDGLSPQRFVVCSQNHDQIGNRAQSDRLNAIAGLEALKVSTAVTILSPNIPMLFMGQEYGEPAPFYYFVDHENPKLRKAVRKGRKREFAAFGWAQEPPNPDDEATFLESKLDHGLKGRQPHAGILGFTKALLTFRREHAFWDAGGETRLTTAVFEHAHVLAVLYAAGDSQALVLYNFSDKPQHVTLDLPVDGMTLVLDSTAAEWGGPGAHGENQVDLSGGSESLLPPYCARVFLHPAP